jgi:hypothetical protein
MADSGQRLIGGSNDRYIALDGAEIVREFTPPSGWTELRLGVQCGFPDSGAGITGAQLAIGLCAGPTKSYNSASPNHFVGITNKNDALGTFNRQVAPVNYYDGVAGQTQPTMIQDGSATLTGGSMDMNIPRFDVASTWYRGIVTVRFRKLAGKWHIDCGYMNTTFWADFTMEDVWECLEWPLYGFQDISNGARVTEQGDPTGLTVDEATYGTLDHVNIWWNKSVPKLEVFGIALQRYK